MQRKNKAIQEHGEDISSALKRWLRMSVDRCRVLPKEIYIPLGVDSGTWSRWTSYEHSQSLPLEKLPTVLGCLDKQAREELYDLMTKLSDGEAA